LHRSIRIITVLLFIVLLLTQGFPVFAAGGNITGTVKDPGGSAVAGAQVVITDATSKKTLSTTTDSSGAFKFDNLTPGLYTLTITQNGFKKVDQQITIIDGKTANINVKLEISVGNTVINVEGKASNLGNTDTNYRQLRDSQEFECYAVNNIVLKRDVGTVTLRSGIVGFLPPILGTVAKAVFVGDAEFNLVPATKLERDHLKLESDNETVTEGFTKAVIYFSDSTYQDIKSKSQPTDSAAGLRDALNGFNNVARSSNETLENIEAELLIELYNPNRRGSFNLYMNGKKNHDLRFHVRPWGAVKNFTTPEEVALINYELVPVGAYIAIPFPRFWYLAHFENEYKNGTASSTENKSFIHTEHYKIETVIEKDQKITASTTLTFKSLMDGDRVLRFGLLPWLRVSRVFFGDEKEASFIQESRKSDGTFYVILPEPTVAGREYKLTMEYRGTRVAEQAGGGNFTVSARTAWYPSSGVFNDRATYDLIFKVPDRFTVISVGKMAKEWHDGDYDVTEWISDNPLVVAGFNYGAYKKKEVVDEVTNYDVSIYGTSGVSYGFHFESQYIDASTITPTAGMNNVMADTQNALRVFIPYFGELPYGRIAVTQQPQSGFGQSWPMLVYLPITAFMDRTTRYLMNPGGNQLRANLFYDEVTPHEVAHQWWGHLVCWATYHDQWLSEGFAHFSTGLFFQLTEKSPDKYKNFWKDLHEQILEKNRYGISPNDAGPIWMGTRLNTHKTPGASRLIYSKGAYVLNMIRAIMWDPKNGDQPFRTMMRDFVKTYSNNIASTEDFKKTVEKHMTPAMDLDDNGRMDWFFNQWVYGTEVPHYKFSYNLTPKEGGKFLLEGSLEQSGVSNGFKMLVPVYGEFEGKIYRIGTAKVEGNNTTSIKLLLPEQPKRIMINHFHDLLSYDKNEG